MTTLDVLVIAQYSGDSTGSNNRFREICDELTSHVSSVELVTSSFVHSKKQQADPNLDGKYAFKITRIHEPGYQKNISFQRIWSHRKLAKNLQRYLAARKKPDVIYCAIPSPIVANAALSYAQRNKVRVVLDVQDLWPEAFEMVIRPKLIAKAMFFPLRMKANEIYKSADQVVTVSQTYSNRVERARNGTNPVRTVYLGTRLEEFDQIVPERNIQQPGILQLVYIGTLGHSYDLPLVFNSLRLLREQGVAFKFHIMGSGPMEPRWQEESADLFDVVKFYGRLPYPEMVSRLKSCDVALNPIVPGSAGSVINKVCDYAAAGLPVVNTQDSDEYRNLLEEFGAGISCEPTPDSVVSAIITLAEDAAYRNSLAGGARHLAITHFDRSISYRRILQLITSED